MDTADAILFGISVLASIASGAESLKLEILRSEGEEQFFTALIVLISHLGSPKVFVSIDSGNEEGLSGEKPGQQLFPREDSV